MDNLTHSLFGAAVAEAYLQKKVPITSDLPRGGLILTSVIANNFPDLDLLFGLIDNSQLGYLLNHRGWTHTVFGAVLQAVLMIGGIRLLALRKGSRLSAHEKHFWLISALGCQTHMLLDFFNSYGVHPFWPISTDWFSLDSIFIIEPLLWLSLLPIWWSNKKRSWLLWTPVFLAYGFGFYRGIVSAPVLATAAAFGAGSLYLSQLIRWDKKASLALLLFTTVVLGFWAHQKKARLLVQSSLSSNSTTKTLDVVLASLPSQPGCWFFVAPQIHDNSYRVLAGTVALYGHPTDCLTWPAADGLQGNATPPESVGPLLYRSAWTSSLDELRPLLKRCDVRAWFQFARVPVWENGIFNDLRFASRNVQNFTTHDASNPQTDRCPPVPAPWSRPRADLLDFAGFRE